MARTTQYAPLTCRYYSKMSFLRNEKQTKKIRITKIIPRRAADIAL